MRLAYDVTVRMLPWPSRPRRCSSVTANAPEVAPPHARDAVVPRQPLVDERVVGVEQLQHAAVLGDDRGEQQLGLAPEGPPQVVVEVAEAPRLGNDVLQVAQVEPLAREVVHQRRRARVGQHPAHLPLQLAGAAQLAALGRGQQRLVGDAAPQKEGQARGQLPVAEAVGGARPRVRRIELEAEEELRAGQQPPQRGLDARLEPAARPTGLVEADELPHVGVRRQAAVGAPRQRREDPLRTGGFGYFGSFGYFGGFGGGRPAGEDAPAGRGVAAPGGGQGAGHDDAADRRQPGHRVRRGIAAEQRPGQALGDAEALDREGRGEGVRAGRQRRAQHQVVVGGQGGRLAVVDLLPVQVRPAVEREQAHPPAVDGQLQLVRLVEAAHVVALAPLQADADLVLAVHREVVRHAQAAARPERHPLAVRVLRLVVRADVGLGARRMAGLATARRLILRAAAT